MRYADRESVFLNVVKQTKKKRLLRELIAFFLWQKYENSRIDTEVNEVVLDQMMIV